MASAPESVWSLGAELGEGPVWVPRDAALWFVDIKRRRVHRLDPANGDRRSWDVPEFVGFVLPAADGGFIAGLQSGLHRFDPHTGGFAPLIAVEPHLPANRLNDGTVDSSGRLWFGTMDNGETAETGEIYRLADGPALVPAERTACITNGPAWSPDGRTMYHCDTVGGRIYAESVDASGALGERRLFATIDPGDGHPDGPSVDADGHVWVGLYGGWCARRYAPDGRLVDEVRFPVANITKIALGGPDGRTAWATSARQGLSEQALATQPQAGDLFAFRVETPAAPSYVINVGI